MKAAWDSIVFVGACLLIVLLLGLPWAAMAFYAWDLLPWRWEPAWARGTWLFVQVMWTLCVGYKMFADND